MAKLRKNRRDAMSSWTKTVGFGYVGRWKNGDVGWFMPRMVGGRHDNEPPNDDASKFVGDDGETFVLCRITVEQVFASNGRAITRRVRRG